MSKASQCVAAIRAHDGMKLSNLISGGAIPAAEVYTWPLLIHAIRENDCACVKILLEAGANWLAKDGYNRNCLEVACLKVVSQDMISLLQSFGAIFTHEAFKAAAVGDISYLADKGKDEITSLLALRDSGGYGIVHYAAVQEHISFLDALQLQPSDVAIESNNELHESPLLLVAFCSSIAMVDYLIGTYKLDPHSPRGSKDGTTALLYAAYSGNIAMLDHFVNKYNADVATHRDD